MGKDTANQESISELKERIKELKQAAQKAEESLDICFDKSEKIEEMIERQNREIEALEKRRGDFLEERNNLITWSKGNPGKPVVIVEGAIMPETIIRGMHSEKRVTEVLRHSKIMEVLCTSADGQSLNIYEMQVGYI